MSSPPDAQALVSVVIPTYRRPRTARLAAESALAQTWTNLEVVVVSDGPDPETRAALAISDPRLRYIELAQNAGPAAARNAGVEASTGEWLAFLDDDDLMLREKIERQMRLAATLPQHTMIACRTIYTHGDQTNVWPKSPIQADQDIGEYILRRPSLLGRPGILPIQALLVHRSILKRVPFTSHADHEDWAWLLEAWYLGGARVAFCWEPLVVYNIEVSAISRSRRPNWADSVAFADTYRKWISDRAYCSFLSTKAAIKAKRAGDWAGLRTIARRVLANNPGPLDLLFLTGTILLPGGLVQRAWKQSLRSEESYGAQQQHPGALEAG